MITPTPQDVFWQACMEGDLKSVKLLLQDRRVDPNRTNKDGWAPLYTACRNGHSAVVELLLQDERVDPNIAGRRRWTPLSAACYHNHLAVVQLLLQDQRVDPGKGSINGWTLLHYACYHGHLKFAKMLLASRPHIQTRIQIFWDGEPHTAAKLAALKNFATLAQLLEDYEANPQQVKKQLCTELGTF